MNRTTGDELFQLLCVLKDIISSFLRKDIFSRYRIHPDLFFFLEMWLHVFLLVLFLTKTYAVSLNVVLPYNMSFFSSCFKDVLFITVFDQVDYDVARCGYLQISYPWIFWPSWICDFMVFIKLGNWVFISTNISPVPFLVSYLWSFDIHLLSCLKLSRSSLMFC